ncbi:hypothetical protein SDC9_186446 [bioreactor metagenome]|uniref:GtrA/DPMS transmembrane domain-containing protein n=1 Tax=bioreactor metagenome TaxID=1076179 RepID=A0A645HIS4_9ZZZZ
MIDKFIEIYKNGEIKKIIRFCLVGLLNTGVDFLTFYILTTFFYINVYSSQICSYITATFNSYFFNRRFTFQSENGIGGKEFFRFVLVNLTSLLTSLFLMFIFNGLLRLDKMICKGLIAFFTFAVNYLGNRFWVFQKKL